MNKKTNKIEPKFPKKVYVYWNEDGEDFWLCAEESAEGCAEKGQTRLAGVYELSEEISVTLEVKENLIVKKAG